MLQGNSLSWTMNTNKNFNSCFGGGGRRKETFALQYSWYSSYLTDASPRYSFTEGFLLHPFFEGRMRLGWVFWYFPNTKAAGSPYRKQLGLTSLALRIWNPRADFNVLFPSSILDWSAFIFSKNMPEFGKAQLVIVGSCFTRSVEFYQSMSFNSIAYILQVPSGP